MSNSEDIITINKVLAGEKAAYAALVNKYKSQAYTLALRVVKNKFDAEEVSQDAFVKAYNSLSKFKQEASFSTWLYRIVYNTALTKINKKQLDTATIDEAHYQVEDNLANTMGNLLSEDRKTYVKKAINQLSDEEAVLVNLYYTHEKDMSEIAGITGLTHVNVRVKLSRIRDKLLSILQKELKGETRSIL